ncbi:unnamed protein product [Rhizophagus irregularis]|nr:unnamed protein product [Rhizophagus irregularis]
MSCSKILSGDIPELIYEVIKYFKTDFSTLHSCILVNRLWCRLTIPLLWEDPFSNPAGNYNFIEIYLHNLSGDSKTKLSEYKINDNLSPSNTLFNYFKYIKNLNTMEFISSVEKWTVENLKFGNRYSNFICISLFKIFIENEIELDNLDIEISNSNLDDILELILQNINFIQNIKILNFYICNYSKNMVTKDRVTQIVNLQRNLKEILLDDNNFPLYQSLLLSDNSNCSNTLKMIIFYNVDFRNIIDYSYSNTYIECSSTILLNLGQILPSKLEYLNLCIFIKANDFEVFLKNIQDTFIKKLVIENLQSQDILPYVKKYIMKRKRIEQLAILTFGWMDLFNLKDEVKEFKSYDIKVRRHCDLSLDSYNKIKRIKNN